MKVNRIALYVFAPVAIALLAFWALNVIRRPVPIVKMNYGDDPGLSPGSSVDVPEALDGPALANPPEITSETKGEFRDVVLIVKSGTVPNKMKGPNEPKTRIGYGARGRYKGKAVGFEVWPDTQWESWTPSGYSRPLLRGYVLFRWITPESRNFLDALSDLYSRPKPATMGTSSTVGAIVLEGDFRKPDVGIVKAKLFFGDEEGSPGYGELFLNIDLKKSRLTLVEKDTAYRRAVINGFAQR